MSRPTPTLDVLVVDDQESFRDAVSDVVASVERCRVVATLSSPEPVADAIRTLAPNLLLMDVRMPPYDGAAVALELRAKYPELKIILMSVIDRADLPDEVLESGIWFIAKQCLTPDAIASVRDRILAP